MKMIRGPIEIRYILKYIEENLLYTRSWLTTPPPYKYLGIPLPLPDVLGNTRVCSPEGKI